MIRLQAVGSYRYAWRQLANGEIFQAESEADAKILKAVGRAVDVKPADVDTVQEQVAIDVDKRRNVARYQRRDMRAED